MRRGGLAFCGGSVAIVAAELFLHLHGADCGIYLDLVVELAVISLAEILDEIARPGTAVAAVGIEPGIDAKRGAGADRNQSLTFFQGFEFVVILNARQIEAIDFLVLAKQRIVGRAENRAPAQTARVMLGTAPRGRAFGGVAVESERLAAHRQSQHDPDCQAPSSHSHEVASPLSGSAPVARSRCVF